MKLFNCRSPFIVTVYRDPAQIATKIELYVWKVGDTMPTTPTKVIEKTKYSDTQYINYYNISPFVYDVINPLEGDFAYNVHYESFYKLDAEWISIDTFNYVSVNGYNDYNMGNGTWEGGAFVLKNIYGNKLYNETPQRLDTIDYFYSNELSNEFFPTIDFVLDFIGNGFDYRVFYETTEFVDDYYEVNEYWVDYINNSTIELHRVPMVIAPIHGTIINTVFKFQYRTSSESEWVNLYVCLLTPICEQKYKPLILSFINRLGGTQQITLFKNSNKTIDVKSSEYNTNTFRDNYPVYDTNLGQKRIFNKNGGTTIKCNTGWISESQNFDIQDLMLSENLYIISSNTINIGGMLGYSSVDTYGAVTLKNTSMLMKTHLNEKVINYELEFELASKLINNVV